MIVLQVWTAPHARAHWDRGDFLLLEADFADFAEAAAHVDGGGALHGSRLWTRKHAEERGVSEVVSRHPMMIAAEGIVRMELPHWRLVEAEGES